MSPPLGTRAFIVPSPVYNSGLAARSSAS